MVNTLAYCDASKITARKRFIMLTSAYFFIKVLYLRIGNRVIKLGIISSFGLLFKGPGKFLVKIVFVLGILQV